MPDVYLLDTGIVLGYMIRAPYARYVDRTYRPFQSPNFSFISVATRGEIEAIAYKRAWGERKRKQLRRSYLDRLTVVSIHQDAIVTRYAEIDAYAANKLPGQPLPPGALGFVLGKNDLWIAATASVYGATLLTTDQDFGPLEGVFLDRIYIDPGADYASY
jgi:tRNA(fMet)-specific endonuclease VapC